VQNTPQQMDEASPTQTNNGVDITLIRWMLSLTPAERLRVLEQHVNAILRIRALNSGR
jgi:hypothetical protein